MLCAVYAPHVLNHKEVINRMLGNLLWLLNLYYFLNLCALLCSEVVKRGVNSDFIVLG